MNKRILSILLCLMLVVSLLVMAVPANAAAAAEVTLTADKTNAKPGDEITFTVTLGPVDAIAALEFIIDVPNGLTLGTVTSNPTVNTEMGFVAASLNNADGAPKFVGFAGDNSNITSDVVLGTFTATVDDDATGTLTVDVDDEEEDSIVSSDSDDKFIGFKFNPATVTIDEETPTDAPATDAPATEAPVTEAPATEAPATDAPVETDAPVATEAHQHTLVKVKQVDATPDRDGVKEHYECTECGKKFSDATGAVEVTDEDLRIPYVAPTEAPATEAPATEAPATEAPATEAPATEAPATEAPATEAPATEAPATEAPATEAPATEAPATEAPATEAPAETDAPAATDAPAETAAPAATDAPEGTDPATVDEAPTTAPSATTPATKDSSTKDTATSTSATAKTGDSTHMYLWMIIMLASLAGACAVLYTAKRKGIFTK